MYEIEMRLAWRHNLLPLVPSFAATMPGVPEHDVADFVGKAATAMTTAQGLGLPFTRKYPYPKSSL